LIVHLRTNQAKRKLNIFILIILYTISVGFMYGFINAIKNTEDIVRYSEHFPDPSIKSKHWGEELSREERTKRSIMFARIAFVQSGSFRDYIDLSGKLQPYEPNKTDRKERAANLLIIKELKESINLYRVFSIVWLLVPLIGIIIGFTTLGDKLRHKISFW